MFGIGNILTAATDPLELLESPLASDFQAVLQQASQGGSGNGGSSSSLLSDILPVAEEVLPLLAFF
jgi:hypothetical protein